MPGQDHQASTAAFSIARNVGASPQRVWDAFTKPAQLAQWFGPKGATTTILAHDLRPGGIVHYRMTTPDGPRMYGRFLYREIAEPSRLVWESAFADEAGNIVRAPFFDGLFPLRLLTTFTFEDTSTGTLLRLLWTPIEASDPERRTVADNTASFDAGWTGSFDRLDRLLA